MSKITPVHVMAVPEPIRNDKRETAHRVKRRHLPALAYEEATQCIAKVGGGARASESSSTTWRYPARANRRSEL